MAASGNSKNPPPDPDETEMIPAAPVPLPARPPQYPGNAPKKMTQSSSPSPSGPARTGFFSIYKKGQGKWTRVGTVLAAILVGSFTT